MLSTEWRLQQSSDIGDVSDEFAVASVVFERPDSGSFGVTVQRHIPAFPAGADSSDPRYVRHVAPSGSDIVTRDAPGGPRQVIVRRPTGLMINLVTSVLLGRGTAVPFSIDELQAMATDLDRDDIESVFPPKESRATNPAGTLPVPTVIGMHLEKAQELLDAVGLSLTSTGVPDATTPTSIVIAQEPQPGSRVAHGETIRVHVRP
jgi:hypothetical protein